MLLVVAALKFRDGGKDCLGGNGTLNSLQLEPIGVTGREASYNRSIGPALDCPTSTDQSVFFPL